MNTVRYALIKDGIVTNIIVFEEPVDTQLVEQIKNEFLLDAVIPATTGASIGGTYDGEHFWGVQRYPSWVRNQDSHGYEAPTPYPEFDIENPKLYTWDEATTSWVEA